MAKTKAKYIPFEDQFEDFDHQKLFEVSERPTLVISETIKIETNEQNK